MGLSGTRKPYNRRKKVNGGLTSSYNEMKKQAKEFYLQSQFSFFYSKAVLSESGEIERIPTLKLFAPQEDVWREYHTKYTFGVSRTVFLRKCKPLRKCKFEKCKCLQLLVMTCRLLSPL